MPGTEREQYLAGAPQGARPHRAIEVGVDLFDGFAQPIEMGLEAGLGALVGGLGAALLLGDHSNT